MESWLITWNPTYFDYSYTACFGIMYVGNKLLIFNSFLYILLTRRRKQLRHVCADNSDTTPTNHKTHAVFVTPTMGNKQVNIDNKVVLTANACSVNSPKSNKLYLSVNVDYDDQDDYGSTAKSIETVDEEAQLQVVEPSQIQDIRAQKQNYENRLQRPGHGPPSFGTSPPRTGDSPLLGTQSSYSISMDDSHDTKTDTSTNTQNLAISSSITTLTTTLTTTSTSNAISESASASASASSDTHASGIASVATSSTNTQESTDTSVTVTDIDETVKFSDSKVNSKVNDASRSRSKINKLTTSNVLNHTKKSNYSYKYGEKLVTIAESKSLTDRRVNNSDSQHTLNLIDVELLRVWILLFIAGSVIWFAWGWVDAVCIHVVNWDNHYAQRDYNKESIEMDLTWVSGYGISYHSKILVTLAFICTVTCQTVFKIIKHDYWTKYTSIVTKWEAIQLILGVLHFQQTRIWFICYGWNISFTVWGLASMVYVLMNLNDLSLLDSWFGENNIWSIIFLYSILAPLSIIPLFNMMIIQFDLISNKCLGTLYKNLPKFTYAVVIFGFIAAVTVGTIEKGEYAYAAAVVIYAAGYDLWYIACDVLNCNGMNVKSTRIFAMGFNLTLVTIPIVLIFEYRVWIEKTMLWHITELDFIANCVGTIALGIYGFMYVGITIAATSKYNDTIKSDNYNWSFAEQRYSILKNLFELMCIECWKNTRLYKILCCVSLKVCCSKCFYIVCTCPCCKCCKCCKCQCKCKRCRNQNGQTTDKGDYVEQKNIDDDDFNGKQVDNGNNLKFFCCLWERKMIICGSIMLFIVGVGVGVRFYMICFFWRTFLLVCDTNSDKKKWQELRETYQRHFYG